MDFAFLILRTFLTWKINSSDFESWNSEIFLCHADHVTLLYLILRRLLNTSFYTTKVMTSVRSPGFSSKRIKLEDEDEDLIPTHDSEGVEPNYDDSENGCSI